MKNSLTWKRYVAAYLDNDVDLQIATWEAVVKLYGEMEAITRFWVYMETLPAEERSGCDPYGN